MAQKKLIKETIPASVHPLFREKLCYTVSKSGVLFRSILEDSLKEHGLVPPEAGILHILSGYGEYNQLLLGHEMSIDKASMVKFIDRLEKRGFVQRMTDPHDRRSKIVTLTPKGRMTQKKIAANHKELEKSVFKNFSLKELELLRRLMPRVLEAVIQELLRK